MSAELGIGWIVLMIAFGLAGLLTVFMIGRMSKRKDLLPYFGLGFVFHILLHEATRLFS